MTKGVLLATTLAALSACSSQTTQAGLEVIVQTDVDPSVYDALWITVEQQTAAPAWNRLVFEPLAGKPPARFAIAPGSSSDQEVRLTVTAYKGSGSSISSPGMPVVVRVEQVQVPRTYVAQLDVELSSSKASCPGTWQAGTATAPTTCTIDLADAGPLPAYRPGAEGFDAGSRDATTSSDSGRPDTSLPRDASLIPDRSLPADSRTDTGRDSETVPTRDAGLKDVEAPADAGPPIIYAHTSDTLYRFDITSNELIPIGAFSSGCEIPVLDIAVNRAGAMYATSFASLAVVDPTSATCTLIATSDAASYPNSLSFVPAGTVDPDDEALVGYVGATYVRIDTTTGMTTPLGSLTPSPNTPGVSYMSSGDVISVIDGGTYLTAIATPPAGSDVLLQIDPKTGLALRVAGPTGQQELFGVGYWAGSVYAFSDNGGIFLINPTSGMTQQIHLQSDAGALQFFGAGSTTAAPTHP